MNDFPAADYSGLPLLYRVGVQHFAKIIDAECYKLDAPIARLARLPIELWYKSRWNVMGDIPEAKRVPT